MPESLTVLDVTHVAWCLLAVSLDKPNQIGKKMKMPHCDGDKNPF